MRYSRYFAGFLVAVGMLLSSVPVAAARDWRNPYGDRPEYRRDDGRDHGRAFRRDDRRVERWRGAIERDRERLMEDERWGRWDRARRDRAELARHERDLDRYLRGR